MRLQDTVSRGLKGARWIAGANTQDAVEGGGQWSPLLRAPGVSRFAPPPGKWPVFLKMINATRGERRRPQNLGDMQFPLFKRHVIANKASAKLCW